MNLPYYRLDDKYIENTELNQYNISRLEKEEY